MWVGRELIHWTRRLGTIISFYITRLGTGTYSDNQRTGPLSIDRSVWTDLTPRLRLPY